MTMSKPFGSQLSSETAQQLMDENTKTGTALSTAGSALNMRDPRSSKDLDLRAIASLAPHASLREISNKDYEFQRYEFISGDLDAARASIDVSMVPASKQQIYAALLTLKVLTSGKAQDDDTVATQVKLYTEHLLEYPADAALGGIKVAADIMTWFPSWHELKEEVEWLCRYRIAAKKAILLEQFKKTMKVRKMET